VKRLPLTFAVLAAFLLAATGARSASGLAASTIHARHREAPTKLYLGHRKVSQLEKEAWDAYLVPELETDWIVRQGDRILDLDMATIPADVNGYARVTSQKSWYVNLNLKGVRPGPSYSTIGTVSYRGRGVWDAYCGLDGHARWFGYATGAHAGMGAVALLLEFGHCGD